MSKDVNKKKTSSKNHKNLINKKCLYPRIDKVYFNVEEWCSEYMTLTDKDLKNMENYIYKLFSKLQKELNEFSLNKYQLK